MLGHGGSESPDQPTRLLIGPPRWPEEHLRRAWGRVQVSETDGLKRSGGGPQFIQSAWSVSLGFTSLAGWGLIEATLRKEALRKR